MKWKIQAGNSVIFSKHCKHTELIIETNTRQWTLDTDREEVPSMFDYWYHVILSSSPQWTMLKDM